jgi:The GLUG motif
MLRIGIVSITAVLLVVAALSGGMPECAPPATAIPIADWYDLDAIIGNLQGSYVLVSDLDSTTPGYQELASPAANGGKGWQPIAPYEPWSATTLTGFRGTLDGQGYEIRDLYINRPEELGAGLFVEIGQRGVIKDIRVVNASVTGGGFVGLFSVISGEGYVENTGVMNSTVTGGWFVGGLVGDNLNGTVNNCYFTGSVSGSQIVGGLVGQNAHGTVSNCYFVGTVAGNYSVGGLVGSSDQASVSGSYSAGSVSGNTVVGGLVGGNSQGNVSDCYSTGSVRGGNITGGLVGENDRGTISNSFSTGSVIGGEFTGGLVGAQFYWGSVTGSFWDIETSGQSTSEGGTGKTTAEMGDIAKFSTMGWDICAVPPAATKPSCTWNILDGGAYPFLSWQLILVPEDQQPIEITSVVGPIAPYNPGGPVIDVTVKNVAAEPVVSLTATLQIPSGLNTVFGISFNVTPSNPLLPGGSVSARRTLIGGGIRSGDSYPLTIDATLQDGAQFVYTTVVQIAGP